MQQQTRSIVKAAATSVRTERHSGDCHCASMPAFVDADGVAAIPAAFAAEFLMSCDGPCGGHHQVRGRANKCVSSSG